LAAPIAATVIGVPTPRMPSVLCFPIDGYGGAARRWHRCGGRTVSNRWPYGGLYDHLYLDIYPPSLQPPGGEHVTVRQPLRPVPFAGVTDSTGRLEMIEWTDRPLVYLTFGTVFRNDDAFRAAFAGPRQLDVGLVVTVGRD